MAEGLARGGDNRDLSASAGVGLKKDLKAILEEARRQGWRVELRKGGHYRLYPPSGRGSPITTGSTPGDRRALLNLVARMRRYGFRWKGR